MASSCCACAGHDAKPASGVSVRTLTVGDPVPVFGFVLGRDDSTLLVPRVRNDMRELAMSLASNKIVVDLP